MNQTVSKISLFYYFTVQWCLTLTSGDCFVVGVVVAVVMFSCYLDTCITRYNSRISPQPSMRCEVNLGVFRLMM